MNFRVYSRATTKIEARAVGIIVPATTPETQDSDALIPFWKKVFSDVQIVTGMIEDD